MAKGRGKRKQKGHKPSSGVTPAPGTGDDVQAPGLEGGPAQTRCIRVSRRRLWAFRIVAALVVPVLVMLILEAGLRVFGYGYPAGAILPCRAGEQRAYRSNPRFTWRFFPPAMARTFWPFFFPEQKTSKTCRIFVLGASAAVGIPDASYGLARQLQVLLEARYPGVTFEVVNSSLTAINSHVVLPIARDCARLRPDVFVVYMGNNEVVGPYGPGTVFAPLSPHLSVIRSGIWIRSTRVGQLTNSVMTSLAPNKAAEEGWRGLEMFLGQQVRPDSPELQCMYSHFRRNLMDICKAGRDAGARVVVCTVACNLKDCPPFGSQHRPDLDESMAPKWEAAYRQGVAHEEAAEFAEAIEAYKQAEQIDETYADLQFRLGRCHWALEEYSQARDRFVKARDCDTLRFRSDSRINQTIRSVAQDKDAAGLAFVDAVSLFDRNSPHLIPGEELFVDHVHFTFRGNHLLAGAVLQEIEKGLPEAIAAELDPAAGVLTQQQCAVRLAYTDWDRERLSGRVLESILGPPFTNQLYHDAEVERRQHQHRQLAGDASRTGALKAAAAYRRAIAISPEDWTLRNNYLALLLEEAIDPRAAKEQLEILRKQLPDFDILDATEGQMLMMQGDWVGASETLRRCLRKRPAQPGPVHYNLGLVYSRLGEQDKAIEHLAKAVEFAPRNLAAYEDLAIALRQSGRIEEAVEVLRTAVQRFPDRPVPRFGLATMLRKQGQTDEAIEHLREVLRIDPNAAEARQMLQVLTSERPLN